MKFKGSISILAILIAALSFIACTYGVFSNEAAGQTEFLSIYGESVQIYGKGLYQKDSVAVATQGIAQDIVTLVVGLPLLLISLYMYRKGSFKGKLLLTGTIGYFLYTYTSYCFVWMYNSFFLIYVFLMSASLFAFILTMMSFDFDKLDSYFDKKLPIRLLGGFLIFFGVMIGLMWIGRIVPPLMKGNLPIGLEHYSTLVIQAMDLGFIVPVSILSGVLVMKRRPFGYLLSSVIYMKGITLATAVTAMLVGQLLMGVKVGMAEIIIFPVINIFIVYCMFLILKGIKEPEYQSIKASKHISQ
ncbi:MAG: hypothetical protein K0Q99_547 [Clostridia bacterium]|jgi:hypothetical protein|nr:hypothetical protein [Clostridia bacterium]